MRHTLLIAKILVSKMEKVDGVKVGDMGVLIIDLLQIDKAVVTCNQVRRDVSFAVDDGALPISATRMVSLLRSPGMMMYCIQTRIAGAVASLATWMANALWILQKLPRCSIFMMNGGCEPSLSRSVQRVFVRPMQRKAFLSLPCPRLLHLHRLLLHRLKLLFLHRLKFLKVLRFILDGSLLLRLMLFLRLVLVCSLSLLLEPR